MCSSKSDLIRSLVKAAQGSTLMQSEVGRLYSKNIFCLEDFTNRKLATLSSAHYRTEGGCFHGALDSRMTPHVHVSEKERHHPCQRVDRSICRFFSYCVSVAASCAHALCMMNGNPDKFFSPNCRSRFYENTYFTGALKIAWLQAYSCNHKTVLHVIHTGASSIQ
jgi:hypothetical protein